MKIRNLTTEEKARIVGMRQARTPGPQIAHELGLPKSTIDTVLKNYELRKTVESPKQTGRPPKFLERDKRSLRRVLCKDRRQTLSDVTNALPVRVSTSTVRRSTHELGFHARVAAKKPFLSNRHTVRRYAFAQEHKNWTIDDWKRVIWTDESSFEIGKNSRQTLVWRRTDERFHSYCTTPSFKSGRTSVMVWGAFLAGKKLPLVFMPPGRRTAVDFVQLVYELTLGPFLDTQETSGKLVLMEDGAPVHRSNVPKVWREARQVTKMNWPANSPDLNPIENLWKVLKDRVQTHHRPKNVNEMKLALEREWENLSPEKLESLVATMPERMKAVVEAKGGATRW